jgi:hypothetical protein
MYKSELPTEDEYPKQIANGVTVKIGHCGMTKGPDRVTSYLKELTSEGDTDDGNAERYSQYEMYYCHPKAVDEKPDKVANKFHYFSS